VHPKSGGRVVLDLVGDGGVGSAEVVYRAALYSPDERWDGEARVGADGAVAFVDWAPANPPAWLVDFARAFLRSEWRARHSTVEPAPWPARINRWRAG
jgi:hypothetical protein